MPDATTTPPVNVWLLRMSARLPSPSFTTFMLPVRARDISISEYVGVAMCSSPGVPEELSVIVPSPNAPAMVSECPLRSITAPDSIRSIPRAVQSSSCVSVTVPSMKDSSARSPPRANTGADAADFCCSISVPETLSYMYPTASAPDPTRTGMKSAMIFPPLVNCAE